MRDIDLVLYGASGFTGGLVARRLAQRIPPSIRWAIAGRDAVALRDIARSFGPERVPSIIRAEAGDEMALRAMAERARLVLSTAGPYRSHGSALLRACVDSGTDYVDLAGEADWIGDMIRLHERTAEASGARIVPCCGFDSVPSELGVFRLQSLCLERWGEPAPFIACRVIDFEAKYSGGTLATAAQMAVDLARDDRLAQRLADPFLLTPGFRGPEQPPLLEPRIDGMTGSWVVPFLMAGINTKIVHRSNLLSGHAYGRNFRYDEMVVLPGPAESTEALAHEIARSNPMARRDVAPGQGPSLEALAAERLSCGSSPSTPCGDACRCRWRVTRSPPTPPPPASWSRPRSHSRWTGCGEAAASGRPLL